MKKRFMSIIALLLAALCCLGMLAACGSAEKPQNDAEQTADTSAAADKTDSGETTAEAPSGNEPSTGEPAQPTGDKTSTPDASAKEMDVSYGVYHILDSSGRKFCSTNKISGFSADYSGGDYYNRFTIHEKPNTVGEGKTYAIYKGPDEDSSIGVKTANGSIKLTTVGDRYNVSKESLWRLESADGTHFRMIPASASDLCVTMREGKGTLEEIKDGEEAQLFTLEKITESDIYYDFPSEKGNVVIRIPREYIDQKKLTGATKQSMNNYANWMQEAYEAEVELTGYIPYDIIVFDMSVNQNIVAGVVNNYNFVKADKDFMQNEIKLMVLRARQLDIKDMNFAMLHEMGHMFDSNRAWCFESEAWTDLKLCYVVYKMTLTHKDTDGLIFGCSSSDYGSYKICHTYETLAEGLDIHGPKGAMTTDYGFFGAARLFLLMTYQFGDYNGFGWEPFIKTFHSYQDEGMTQDSFVRNGVFNNWASFTDFVARLSEYSGRDVKNEFLSEENWECFRRYYQHETNKAL